MAKSKKAVESLIQKGISPSQIAAMSEAEFRRELLALTGEYEFPEVDPNWEKRGFRRSGPVLNPMKPETAQRLRNAAFDEVDIALAADEKARGVGWRARARPSARVPLSNPVLDATSLGHEALTDAERVAFTTAKVAREGVPASKALARVPKLTGWWRKLPAWGRLGIKGAGGVLGGLGLLTTAMEIPDMLRTGRDVAEDLGFDPTGRRADAKTRLANEMNWQSRESDPLTVALLGQEQLNSDLTGLENFERADVPGPSDRSIALRDQALLRKLQIDHEEELEQLRGKAVRTDELEDAFHRLMGTR